MNQLADDLFRPDPGRTLNNRQPDLGRVVRRVVHRVACNDTSRLIVVITARVQVAREPRKIATRDLNSNAVSG